MGLYTDRKAEQFDIYRVTLQIRDKLLGGIPQDPRIIEAWLAKGIGHRDAEMKAIWVRTLQEMNIEVRPDQSWTEISEAAAAVSEQKHTNGFMQDEHGLYIESRQVHAMLKENANITIHERIGGKPAAKGSDKIVNTKSAKSVVADQVFVRPLRIHLGKKSGGYLLKIAHLTDWRENRTSSLTYVQYVERPTITFTIMERRGTLTTEQWDRLWIHAEENGLGAARSQDYGTFDVEEFERINTRQAETARRVNAERPNGRMPRELVSVEAGN